MDWGTITAGVIGAIGVVLGIVGLQRSSESNKIANQALKVTKESYDFQVAEATKAKQAQLEIAGMEVIYTLNSPEPLIAVPSVKVLTSAEARKVHLAVFNNDLGWDMSNPPAAVVRPDPAEPASFRFHLDSIELPNPRPQDRFRLEFSYEDDEGAGKELVECVRFGISDGFWLHGKNGELYAQRLDCQNGEDIPWPWQPK